jgi:NitT/TauT family transport system substrate-binding protein
MISLQYGVPTDKEGLQLRLGIEHGFFRAEGLDLAVEVVYGGPEIAARYDSGALRIGELGSPPATTALGKGARFRIVASSVRRRALQYLVVAPGIRDWNDLRGKRSAALSIGSCSYWFSRTLFLHNGLDPDRDLELVGLGLRYPKVVDLFEQGELQAAVISEPNVAIGEARGAFRVMQALHDPAYCPGMQWAVVVAGLDTIRDEPDVVRAVLRACQRSYHYCADNPDEWAAFGARHFGIDAATMRRAIEREGPDLHCDGVVDMHGLQQAIDLQRELGAVSVPMRAADIVDLRFLPAPWLPA